MKLESAITLEIVLANYVFCISH